MHSKNNIQNKKNKKMDLGYKTTNSRIRKKISDCLITLLIIAVIAQLILLIYRLTQL